MPRGRPKESRGRTADAIAWRASYGLGAERTRRDSGEQAKNVLVWKRRAHRKVLRSRPNSLSHRRRVAVRLLGIGGTEACDRVGVDGPLGRVDINAWPRLVVEMPVAVGAPHDHGGQAWAAGAPHVGRDVAEAETDAPG